MTRIEIDLPDQPNQVYPEAVLRRLFEEGRVMPGVPARVEGAAAWSTVATVLNTLSRSQAPPHAASAPAFTVRSDPAPFRNEEAVIFAMKRYGHGQALVKGLQHMADALQTMGVILGVLTVAGVWLVGGLLLGSEKGLVWVPPLVGVFLGLGVYGFFAARATSLRVQASLLAATIDTAVYVCPFLENPDRLALLRRES